MAAAIAGRARAADPKHVRFLHRRIIPWPLRPRRRHRAVRPQHQPRSRRAGGLGTTRRTGSVSQRDRQIRSCIPARHVVSGEGRHLHQRRTPDQPSTAGDDTPNRQARMADPLRDRPSHGLSDVLRSSQPDHGRNRHRHTHFRRSVIRQAGHLRQRAVALQRCSARGNPDHACRRIRPRQRQIHSHHVRSHDRTIHPQVPTDPDHRPYPEPIQRGRTNSPHPKRVMAQGRCLGDSSP